MKKYFQSGIILVLILWLLGALIYLPSSEDKLASAAKAKLAESGHAGVFAHVKAEFNGQEATLTGAVATATEKAQADALIRNDLHIPGWFNSTMNPVTDVINQITVDPEHAPFRPRPWLILSLYGGNQRLDGVLPSAPPREALLAALAAKLPPPATPLNNQISIAETALPAADWDATLATLPDLTATPKEVSAIAVSTCDGKWASFPAAAANAEIAAALKASKLADNEINHALAKLRSWKNLTPEEIKKQAEDKAAEDAAAKAKADAKSPAAPNKNLGPLKSFNSGTKSPSK